MAEYVSATPASLVKYRFLNAMDYADAAFADALEVFDAIKQMAGDIPDVDVDVMLEDYDLANPDWSAFTIPNPSDYNIEVRELTPPSVNFTWNEESLYSSDLLTILKGKCTTDISGGTGISSSVESDMINRETERDAIINAETRTQVESEWAEFGWDMPDNSLGYNLTQVEDTYQNKRLDKSRDIRVESFNLAQKNIQFAMGLADSLEGKLEMYHTEMIRRKLEAAKYTVDAAIQIFRTTVEYLISKIKIFEAVVDAYKARILAEAEKAKVDVAIFDAKVRQVLGRAQVLISKAQLIITQYIEQNKLRLTAMEEAGKIAAQVAAGALSGVSAQAQISSSDSTQSQTSSGYQHTDYHYTDETTI